MPSPSLRRELTFIALSSKFFRGVQPKLMAEKMKWAWALGALWVLATLGAHAADEGKELYQAACASCHGPDGRGAPQGTAIKVPLPDFTNCSFVTTENTGNWTALVAQGG